MIGIGFGNGIWGLLALAAAIWIIYDVLTNQKKMKDLHKVLWIVGALLAGINIILAIVYYLVVKKK